MIVVTGGSGFIGTHLCKALINDGYNVKIIDIVPPKIKTKAEFVNVDIIDSSELKKAFQYAEKVIHLAAHVDVSSSITFPCSDFLVNAVGTMNVLEAARQTDVKKIVFASSAAVYGDPVKYPIDEMHPTVPLSPYGASKLAAENYVLLYNYLYGMNNVALRLFNVYGTGQNPAYSGVITKFMSMIENNKQVSIYGDGRQTRDFVHVDDVCSAFILALQAKDCPLPLNIASGKEISMNELYCNLCDIYEIKTKPVYLPKRTGDILRSVASTKLAKSMIKYSPQVSFVSGLKNIIRQKRADNYVYS